jgi:hypothetical protein
MNQSLNYNLLLKMMCDSPEILKLPVWPTFYLNFEIPGGDPVV